MGRVTIDFEALKVPIVCEGVIDILLRCLNQCERNSNGQSKAFLRNLQC